MRANGKRSRAARPRLPASGWAHAARTLGLLGAIGAIGAIGRSAYCAPGSSAPRPALVWAVGPGPCFAPFLGPAFAVLCLICRRLRLEDGSQPRLWPKEARREVAKGEGCLYLPRAGERHEHGSYGDGTSALAAEAAVQWI